MYKLAIFDMDGTILDTLTDLASAINHALEACGFPARTVDEVRMFVGNGILKLVERAVPAGSTQEEKDRVKAAFDAYYQEHCLDETRPYAGIVDVIRDLRSAGVKTACVSNKPDYGVQSLCDRFFPGLFDYAVGMKPGMAVKPAPDAVYDVFDALKTEASEAVYIGDSDVDLMTAKNAGTDCISVLWGFRDKAFLTEHGAAVFAEKPEELLTICL